MRARPHRTGRGSASESVAVDDRRGGRVGIDRVASDSPSRDNRYRAGSHGAGAGSAGSAVPAPDQPGPPPRRRRELAGHHRRGAAAHAPGAPPAWAPARCAAACGSMATSSPTASALPPSPLLAARIKVSLKYLAMFGTFVQLSEVAITQIPDVEHLFQSLTADISYSQSNESYFDHERIALGPLLVLSSEAYYTADAKKIKHHSVNVPSYHTTDSKGIFPPVQHS